MTRGPYLACTSLCAMLSLLGCAIPAAREVNPPATKTVTSSSPTAAPRTPAAVTARPTPMSSVTPTVPVDPAVNADPGLHRRPTTDPVWDLDGGPATREPKLPKLPTLPAGTVGVAVLRGGWGGRITVPVADTTRVLCSVGTQGVGGSRITEYRYAISSVPRNPELSTFVDLDVPAGAFTVLITHIEREGGPDSDEVVVTVHDDDSWATGFADPTHMGHALHVPVFGYGRDRRTVRLTATLVLTSDWSAKQPLTSWESITAALRCPTAMPAPPWTR